MEGINVCDLYKSYKAEKVKEGSFFKNFFKREYEIVKAIDGINFNVKKGEMVGLIGPNGAGKTTLLKMLSGVLYPDKGEIRIDGFIPFRRDRKFLENITFFTGQRSFLSIIVWDLAAIEGYELLRDIYRIDRKTFKERIDYFTDILNASDLINKPLRKLSLGERTKVELIGSLLHFPEYVLLDEPTIGLDIVSQKNLWDFFKHYNQERKATLIITSHYIRDIEELGKRVILLNKGKIIYDGERDEIREKIQYKKTIKIELSEETKDIPFEEYDYEDGKIILNVENDEINETLKKIASMKNVIDIEITEPSFEFIIRELYKV
uniref:ATP-binding cassette domain-containing protein n=1 Tax=candidate division WOR-3 bacterium TaxID=2052148 RepID=A0A7C4YSJ1_UNCW3